MLCPCVQVFARRQAGRQGITVPDKPSLSVDPECDAYAAYLVRLFQGGQPTDRSHQPNSVMRRQHG